MNYTEESFVAYFFFTQVHCTFTYLTNHHKMNQTPFIYTTKCVFTLGLFSSFTSNKIEPDTLHFCFSKYIPWKINHKPLVVCLFSSFTSNKIGQAAMHKQMDPCTMYKRTTRRRTGSGCSPAPLNSFFLQNKQMNLRENHSALHLQFVFAVGNIVNRWEREDQCGNETSELHLNK